MLVSVIVPVRNEAAHIRSTLACLQQQEFAAGNFEVLVGFDVTPEMADFNRQGKRFFANAGVPKTP